MEGSKAIFGFLSTILFGLDGKGIMRWWVFLPNLLHRCIRFSFASKREKIGDCGVWMVEREVGSYFCPI